ncbi:MAG: hypothetical protein A2275_02420 [Bacteroidetes bacterium RIFOXYA12_FULL_35_11]|nr:MAG: hypothetical protein A2X01_03720 [Bacteroidetes bacterium GWF2_35_48]OFY75268.1 MAG: hypothetical protein A2275_02420 [Bacteroidetes bacterium RIFOXYA12_FULL_35_11]OFY99344.1 MAG: hypothetical protein A2491_04385 [Bacteroidetes bacterium RIFOXYC12_FULL_35_7]HBX51020.1 two-component sensor histidine kinase [Bacteroidales bacterium]
MKIRYRIALKFTLISASLLLLFSFAIYFFSAKHRSIEFIDRIKNHAISSSIVLYHVDEVDSSVLEKINKSTLNLLFNEKIYIYDINTLNLIYKFEKDTTWNFTTYLNLEEIIEDRSFAKNINDYEIVGITYPKKKPEILIIALAKDEIGIKKLETLKFILIIGFLCSVIITIIVGVFFASNALKPISNLIKQIDGISAAKLNKRIEDPKEKDEIATLSSAFNKMLDRLESSFEMQKNFVSNVSHELRTPLTSINGEIEVTLIKKRNIDEYEETLKSIHADIQNLISLSNGFLELAEASLENVTPKFISVRLDELIFTVKEEMQRRPSCGFIDIIFIGNIEDEDKLTVLGNPYLIKVMFINLIDNAWKFSFDKKVNICIHSDNNILKISFSDIGKIIQIQEIEKIVKPFQRGKNAKGVSGHGIGLAIVSKIITLHNGNLHIESDNNGLTNISVIFNKNIG